MLTILLSLCKCTLSYLWLRCSWRTSSTQSCCLWSATKTQPIIPLPMASPNSKMNSLTSRWWRLSFVSHYKKEIISHCCSVWSTSCTRISWIKNSKMAHSLVLNSTLTLLRKSSNLSTMKPRCLTLLFLRSRIRPLQNLYLLGKRNPLQIKMILTTLHLSMNHMTLLLLNKLMRNRFTTTKVMRWRRLRKIKKMIRRRLRRPWGRRGKLEQATMEIRKRIGRRKEKGKVQPRLRRWRRLNEVVILLDVNYTYDN